MKDKKREINLLIAGDETSEFSEAISSIEKKLNIDLNINTIHNIKYSKIEYFNKFVDLIDEYGNYFNIIALNYKKKSDILSFFEYFNQNYDDTCLISSTYPFFLIDNKVFKKVELYNEIKKINQKRPDLYKFNSKDIIEYKSESLPEKILGIYNYYLQRQEERRQQTTLNIMVCGKKRTGKTYFINELLFENKGLSKENNYTTKITCYEHKLFPIMIYDFPGFSDNEDQGMVDATNYISKFNDEFKNLKNKIHIIFYMLQNDSGRVLQDKEIELIENFLKNNIPVFFITNRLQKNNYKSFIRNVEERMKHIKTDLKLEELKSHLFVLDSTNKSIKKLLNSVIDELKISKVANENIINELSKKIVSNDSNYKNDDKNENLISSFEIIENPIEEEKGQINHDKILEEMKKSIFFNNYSKTFKKVEQKINEIIGRIQKESNTHLIPLLSARDDLLQLFNELKTEFEKFLSEEKMEINFPELNEISKVNMDENSIVIILNAIICFICVLAFGTTGTFSLAMGLPFYFITGNQKKKKIELLLKENANNMFKKFKNISIDDHSIKRTAEEYNNIIQKFIQFSNYFDSEHENDIDLLK